MNQKHISGNTKLVVFAQSIFGQPSRSQPEVQQMCTARHCPLHAQNAQVSSLK